MDPTDRNAIERNLFSIARTIIDERPRFPWHRDQQNRYTAVFPHSSQALAVDVLWTIRTLASRDRIMDAWCHKLDLPFSGPWNIELEELVAHDTLGESRRNQIDAVARSPNGTLVMECKFTEKDGGGCSQWKPLSGKTVNAGLVQCNGNYEPQVNPVNGKSAHCALTGKGIRYWEIIPTVFGFDAGSTYRPCPFKGGWYQWMRNLVVAHEISRTSHMPAAFIVLYADGPFSMPRKIRAGDDWRRLIDNASIGSIPLMTASYQSLLAVASVTATADEQGIVQDLRLWVDAKIKEVTDSPVKH
jgi:hypothetical protein